MENILYIHIKLDYDEKDEKNYNLGNIFGTFQI